MFDYSRIVSGLAGKVGFRQNADQGGIQLTGLTSATHYMQDVHPMLTIENLLSICPDFDAMTLSGTKAEAFTGWLSDKLDASLKKMLGEWRGLKLQGYSARTLVERERLFRPQTGDGSQTVRSGKFVGLEFVLSDSMNLSLQIERVALQLVENQTFNLYLFREGEANPVQTKSVTYSGSGSVQWVSLNWKASGAGKYFLVYDESDIAGNSINGADYSDHLSDGVAWYCGNHLSLAAFSANRNEAVGIGSMDVEGSFVVSNGDVSAYWNPTQIDYTYSTNYGLNAEVSVVCDYSDLVINRADDFALPWAYRAACDLLRELVYNPSSRLNRNELNVDAKLILYEIDGDSSSEKRTGLFADYRRELAAVMFDDSDIDPVCLPCKKRGARFRAKG